MTVRLALSVVGVLAASASVTGCSTIVERTAGAPEWFNAKSVEIRGDGYPDLRDVPNVRPPLQTAVETEQRASTLKVELKSIEDQASDPIPTPDEIRARAAQLRAKADESVRPDPRAAGATASGSP